MEVLREQTAHVQKMVLRCSHGNEQKKLVPFTPIHKVFVMVFGGFWNRVREDRCFPFLPLLCSPGVREACLLSVLAKCGKKFWFEWMFGEHSLKHWLMHDKFIYVYGKFKP